MENINSLLKNLAHLKGSGYFADRILSQIEFAHKMNTLYTLGYDNLIHDCTIYLTDVYKKQGAITKKAVLSGERILSALSSHMKKFTMLYIAHAHIDMNWQWRYDETVTVVLDTFRTMLDLLDQYPDFKFSQSQASVYEICEEFDPDMLIEIKKYIKQGRWEVTASTWVEADRNLATTESKVRHILYTKKYLSNLLDLDSSYFDLDYEPDTFGHSVNDPEVLVKAGIKYYYHVRGFTEHMAYIWQAPSKAKVLVYNDATYYNGPVHTTHVQHMPSFCHQVNTDTMIHVYGVGDHGGGPSRKDIESIIDMNTWPIWPNTKFGTYKEFFGTLEKIKDTLPVVNRELDFIFTGCYSSQAKIKRGNKMSLALMNQAETFSALTASRNYMKYPGSVFEKGWRKILFNQFHDIITGSGSGETREHALGQYHYAFAAANANRGKAMNAIAKNINLSQYELKKKEELLTVSEGAGTSSGVMDFKVSQICRGRGPTRVFTVFNPSGFTRNEVCEMELWNWEYDPETIKVFDHENNRIEHMLVSNEQFEGWDTQRYYKILINADVPAFGYSTYILKPDTSDLVTPPFRVFERFHKPVDYILENDQVKACFNPVSLALVSYVDKKTGYEYVDNKSSGAIFRIIKEATIRRRTSWIVAKYISVNDIDENIKVLEYKSDKSLLRQSITYAVRFLNSDLYVTVYLDKTGSALVYDVKCDWKEFGVRDSHVPQLNFIVPLSYKCDEYKYETPGGVVTRESANDDRPSTGFVSALKKENDEKSLAMYCDSKYGYRTYDDSIALTLIRASYEPDPHPEPGIHKFKFAMDLLNTDSNKRLIDHTSVIRHPLSCISVKPQKGKLPPKSSLLTIEKNDSCIISSVKMGEYDKSGILVRMYEVQGEKSEVSVKFDKNVLSAKFTTLDELHEISDTKPQILNDSVNFFVEPYSVVTLVVKLG